MQRITIALEARHSVDGEPLVLDALDVPTALAIADINTETGSAELWEGSRRLGRLTRHGGPHAAFWEVTGA